MDAPFFAMVFFGVISAIGAGALIKRQFSVKQYSYSSPKIIRLPEGGSGSCSSDGNCEWGQGTVREGQDYRTEYARLYSEATGLIANGETGTGRLSPLSLSGAAANYAAGGNRTGLHHVSRGEPERSIEVENWPVSTPIKRDSEHGRHA